MTFTATDLDCYTAYDFKLQVFNEEGGADFPEWVQAETLPSGWYPIAVLKYSKLLVNQDEKLFIPYQTNIP